MKSLFDAEARSEIVQRINKLRPDTKTLWGKLNSPQIVCHFIDGFKVAFNEKKVDLPKGFLTTGFGRWLIIDSPMPWPKGSPSHPLYFEQQPGNFEQDRQALLVYVDRFSKGPNQEWGISPGFGKLSPDQWARLNYRHCDHHLRQLGV